MGAGERGRAAPRAAWSLWGLMLCSFAPGIGLLLTNDRAHGSELVLVAAVPLFVGLSYGLIGSLVASRVPRNPIGWMFVGGGLAVGLTVLFQEYAVRGTIAAPGSLPLVEAAAFLGSWLFMLPIGSVPLLFLLFPDGRLPSRRWRLLAAPVVLGGASIVLSVATSPGFYPQTLSGLTIPLRNPIGFEPPELWWVGVIWFLLAVGCVTAPVIRWRRAIGEERDQLKWFGRVAVVMAAGPLLAFVLSFVPFVNVVGWSLGGMSLVLGLILGIPAAFAVSILRHRLFGIDVVIKRAVVLAILAGFITLVYVAVLVAVPAMIRGTGGGAESGGLDLLSFVAIAIVAVAFQPVRARAGRWANRLVYGARATPYEVLSELTDRVGGVYSTEDVLPRLVRILAAGTGARKARVWLRVGDELRPAATHPPDEGDGEGVRLDDADEGQTFPVLHQGEPLGALTVIMPPSEPLGPEQERLVRDLAAQAGLVLRNVRLNEELKAKVEELRASRQRLVAAADRERRRIERDLHDGAQQQLVALAVKLRLADGFVDRDPEQARRLLVEVRGDAQDALDTLRDLARGIYPPLLADRGLADALTAQGSKAPLPVEVRSEGVGRYPPETEAAVYFCCLEALQNVAKYAGASGVTITLSGRAGTLAFSVTDDGRGFDPGDTPRGAGLQNMADRLAALGGSLQVSSAPGEGTVVSGTLPVEAPAPERTPAPAPAPA